MDNIENGFRRKSNIFLVLFRSDMSSDKFVWDASSILSRGLDFLQDFLELDESKLQHAAAVQFKSVSYNYLTDREYSSRVDRNVSGR